MRFNFFFRPDSGSEFAIETELEAWELDVPYRFQQEVVHLGNVYRYQNPFSPSLIEPVPEGNAEWEFIAAAAARTVHGRVWGVGALGNWDRILANPRWWAQSRWVLISGGTSVTRSGNNLLVGSFAPIQAARMGKSVVLIHPGSHFGGMTSGGLGFVDVGDPLAVGGLTREYFHKVWKHYQEDAAWRWEEKHPMRGQHSPLPPDQETMWIVEPSVAENLFDQMAGETDAVILRDEWLDRENGVKLDGQRIVGITMLSGLVVKAGMFMDATYEGDLMAAAGVSYTVGREANSQYNETINGKTPLPPEGALPDIDPYLTPGYPGSGLLPRIHADTEYEIGAGDCGVQAYNYRMCLTRVPENRVRIEKPAGYDEAQYEIIFRFIEAGGMESDVFKTKFSGTMLKNDRVPNGKTDTNNNGYISTDLVGVNWDYPEADYDTRARMNEAHETWQRGLIWILQNHPRVPEHVREHYEPWGLAADEFVDNGHWPTQLYIREARRMVADHVVTERIARKLETVPDPVGQGSYAMDSHAVRWFVSPRGFMTRDGGMFHSLPGPYGISYRAIVPKRGECSNLLVPICASASHAAYGSLRMEPTFMVLGQSAATAACLAIDLKLDVQDVPYDVLRIRLEADGQILG